MILYLLGPMTFRKDTDFNYPTFARNAELLRQAGYTVLAPNEVDPEQDSTKGPTKENAKPWGWYMRRTLAQVLQAQAIAVIDGELAPLLESEGAGDELYIARRLKMPIRSVDFWVSLAIQNTEFPYAQLG